ncbi:RDD family protein [Luteococcus japonicus]|uniref:RDD family protein n=1 Tax=Luteococcus japonicus TaxID=33984 RepID=A0A3N1ZS67_9ACTN|nr:DUF2510 domain-containing protein [Luteococcus japonicus]ROR53716.1 RDD family protein [Luteococcus japonicus]
MTQHALAAPVAGWYPDPSRQAPLRWWDGASWTSLTTAGAAVPTATAGVSARTAGWWERARGYLLDAALLWFASLMVLGRFHEPFLIELVGILRVSILTDGGIPGPLQWWDYGLVQMWLVTAIPGVVLRVAYDMICLVWRGATVGHARNDLRVVSASAPVDLEGPRGLVWHRALRRSLVLRLLAPTCLGWLVCVLWPLWDPQSRSLTDLAAGTRVVSLDHGLNPWG